MMRWVDMNSDEFSVNEDYKKIRELTRRAIEVGAMVPNKDGNLYINGTNTPITDEINGEVVGVRFCQKACN